MSEWISVEDRLPVCGVAVLVLRSDGSQFVADRQDVSFRHPSEFAIHGGDHVRTWNVVCWQSLPDPPKPEGPFDFTGNRIEFLKDGHSAASLQFDDSWCPYVVGCIVDWVNKVWAEHKQ